MLDPLSRRTNWKVRGPFSMIRKQSVQDRSKVIHDTISTSNPSLQAPESEMAIFHILGAHVWVHVFTATLFCET